MRSAIRATVLTRVSGGLLASLVAVVPTSLAAQTQELPPTVRADAGLSLPTFAMRHERRLLARDTDGDGKVSRAEFLAGAERSKGDPGRRFAGLDRNGDGAIDKGEIDAMAARRFAQLDADCDGVLTVGERTAGKARATGSDPAG